MPKGRPGDYGHVISPGILTPTPGKQIAALGAIVLIGAAIPRITAQTGIFALQQAKKGASFHRKIVGPATSVMSAYSTVDAFRKIRGGGHRLAFDVDYEPWDPKWVPPFPYLGQIPLIRPRLEIGAEPYEQTLSRAREDTVRSSHVPGPVETPKTIGGPSAQTKPGTSRKKPRGMISLANRRGAPTSGRRRPRTVRYRKGGCPPGYRYDRRRKMCVLIK